MRNKLKLVLIISQIILIFFLFLYSYTQVDLGLTLNSSSYAFLIQRAFQSVGYFQRPLSASIYLAIQAGLILTYVGFIYLGYKKNINWKNVKYLGLFQTLVLILSYNAFSHDLFNYIFYTKIIAVYGQNPYLVRALDFPNDPMLSFMHWTHNTYPYGPTWLVYSVPLGFISKGYFIVNFFLFKFAIGICYFGSLVLINRISNKISTKDNILPAVLFGFSPLVITESLVSSHNDIVMMFFAIMSLYLIISRRFVLALITFIFSIGMKYATILLTPVLSYIVYLSLIKVKIDWQKIMFFTIVSMLLAVVAASLRTNFQPWYLLYVIPFVCISARFSVINIFLIIFSMFSVYYYLPYLFYGNWDSGTVGIINNFLIASLLVSLISALIIGFILKKRVLKILDK